jgi:hypothetical protein
MAALTAVKIENDVWEFRFPVPIPEKLWEVRARWPIGGMYWKNLVRDGKTITPVLVDGHVEKIVLRGKHYPHNKLELDLNSPGEPYDPFRYHDAKRTERHATILSNIPHDDADPVYEEGTCVNCEEELDEGSTVCSECGHDSSTVSPTLGELVEKYGPDARPEVSYDRSGASLSIRYNLDDEGLAQEKAEIQAKYDAEMAEYKVLKAEWDELAQKVNAYNAAEDEAHERAKFAELKAKYEA